MATSEKLNTEFILIAGSFGMLLLTVAVILFIYLYQRKLIKRKLAYQKIEDALSQKELQTTYALIEGQDTERQRIARELHDSLGSILVTLTMYTDSLTKTETITEKQRSLIEKISSIGKQAYQETRRISRELDASMHKHFGLQSALEDLLGVIHGINDIEVKTSFEILQEPSVDVSFNLYRITQELINNTLKYAKASTIRLELTQVKNEYLSYIYQDDGVGMEAPTNSGKGMGMRNIATRVEKLGGTSTLHTAPEKGFTIIIEIPLT